MTDKIYDICIIGAGPSGLVAAIESSRRGLSCVVVDKNKKPGMKLYATGNGRCNITNDTWEEDSYYDNAFVDRVFDSIYSRTGMRQRSFVLDYFARLGVRSVNKKGYFYPASLQASTVVWALVDAAKESGVELISRCICTDITRDTELFYINSSISREGVEDSIIIKSRNIIIATGGLSQERLGATNEKLVDSLFSSLRIPYRRYESGLCPVKISEDLSVLAGVRTTARISVAKHSEIGEVQINEDSISGIVTYNMSYYMSEGQKIIINLLPRISEDEFVADFNEIKTVFPDKRLDLFLNGFINDKLAAYMIHRFYGISDIRLTLKDVTETGIRGLYQELTEWTVSVLSKCGFDHSQASIGGIVTDIIDPYSMQLSDRTIGEGVYAVGEATDVIGKCGGYNLTYAFITGYLAGTYIEK